MEIKPGYKLTELGVIPEDWEAIKLGKLSNFVSSGKSKKRTASGEYHFYGSTGIIGYCNTPEYNGERILIARVGANAGSLYTVDGRYSVSDNTLVIGLKDSNLTGYIANYLLKENLNRIVFGSGQPLVTGTQLKQVLIAMPTHREEIDSIVEAISNAGNLITSLEKLIEKKKLIKQGVMQELLTGKRRLPGFSGEWETKRLGNICEIMKGSGLSKSSLSDDGSSYCILYGELFTKYNELIENPVSKTDSTQGLLSQTGDVLLPGSTTTTGIDLAKASSLMSDDVRIGGDINVLRPLEGIYGPYLALQINTVLRNRIAEKTKGITIHHLHGKDMIDIVVNVPSLEEQVQISQTINSIERDLFKLHFKHLKLSYLKQAMMQELLTGRIRLI